MADDAGAGRNFCHAVVGPIDVLTPIAVTLTAWPGWRDPAEAAEPADAEDEADFADEVLAHRADLLERFKYVPADPVRNLLALVFHDPDGRFGLTGIEPALVPATLFAVQEICRIVGRTEPWTFTTFAGGTAPGSLPRFAFMGELPTSMPPEAGDRRYTDLARTVPGVTDDDLRVADWMYGRFCDIWSKRGEVRNRDWAAWGVEFGKHAGSAESFAERLRRYAERRGIGRTWFEPPHAVAEQKNGDQVPWPQEADETAAGELPPVVAETPLPEPEFQPAEQTPVSAWQPAAAPAFSAGSEPMPENATSSVEMPAATSWSAATPADPLWWRIAQAGSLAELDPILSEKPIPVLSASDRMMLWDQWRKGKLADLLRKERHGRQIDYLKGVATLLLGEPGDRGMQDQVERELRKWSRRHYGNDSREVWNARRVRDVRTRTLLGRVRADLENVPAIVWALKGVLVLLILLTGMILLLGWGGLIR
ncbi:hypothetical protein [Amycolatopsis sp. Hca4]|uniref:hypothetical protein n=1 Tax=Amycolatopsis sp. Hca4 TaxID=2742131 RepID=UPI001591798D|nr:hypothetical protein [Amycolatopsis sp. Hca4]QKV79936.1 hypothetical protein HUT10_43650 [Amycolatopsis sp. Hca4]